MWRRRERRSKGTRSRRRRWSDRVHQLSFSISISIAVTKQLSQNTRFSTPSQQLSASYTSLSAIFLPPGKKSYIRNIKLAGCFSDQIREDQISRLDWVLYVFLVVFLWRRWRSLTCIIGKTEARRLEEDDWSEMIEARWLKQERLEQDGWSKKKS